MVYLEGEPLRHYESMETFRKLPCVYLELSSTGESLKDCREYMLEMSHYGTKILWDFSIDFSTHWLRAALAALIAPPVCLQTG